MITLTPTHEDRLIAGYAALAILIHVLEAGFPTLIPGIKPGLANVVTLIVLLRYSWRMALWVSLLRVLVGSLLVGSFMAPGFWLSLSGAVASLSALGLAYALSRTVPALRLSPIGLSVISALAHMAGQFALAYQVFVPHPGLLRLLPLLMSVATGLAAQALLQRLPSRHPPPAA